MAHFAVGDGWETTFQIVNASDAITRAVFATLGNSGAIQGVPVFVDDEMFYTSTYLYRINRILQPHAIVGLYSAEPGSVVPIVGSANLHFDPGVGAFVRFRLAPTGQEAMVPMETRMARSFTLGFDNTSGIATGIAVAAGSYDTVPSGVTSVTTTVRDDAGNVIDSATTSMNVGTHDSFVLSDRFPSAAGKKRNHSIHQYGGGTNQRHWIAFPSFKPLQHHSASFRNRSGERNDVTVGSGGRLVDNG